MNTSPRQPDPGHRSPATLPTGAAIAMVAAMIALAAFFLADPAGDAPPLDQIAANKPAYSDTATVRKVRTEMTFEGTPCDACHEGKEELQGHPVEKGVFHDKIALKHGRNRQCFNCHHRLQPANFSDYDGSPIKLANIELLCAKCHGTTYRDWKNGAHGRREGYWEASKGKFKTEVCIACHDPHWPIFKPTEAAPAPHVNPRTREAAGRVVPAEGSEGGHH